MMTTIAMSATKRDYENALAQTRATTGALVFQIFRSLETGAALQAAYQAQYYARVLAGTEDEPEFLAKYADALSSDMHFSVLALAFPGPMKRGRLLVLSPTISSMEQVPSSGTDLFKDYDTVPDDGSEMATTDGDGRTLLILCRSYEHAMACIEQGHADASCAAPCA